MDHPTSQPSRPRVRDVGLRIGVLPTGTLNAITDVADVRVGQVTIVQGDDIRTGVTAILPHGDNLFQQKPAAAVYVGNGFGKLAGSTQVNELGTLETPIVLTNTLGVGAGIEGAIRHTLAQAGNEKVRSVNALVGETNDGGLNEIRRRVVTPDHVLEAIAAASDGPVAEGNVGAGTGTICFGFKGGIGTSSRVLPGSLGGFRVGVLVQSNFGGVLQIDGAPIGRELGGFSFERELRENVDGSCMMVVATDAPMDARQLMRLGKRAFLGLAKTGGIAANGSGDYVVAFSTTHRVAHVPVARTRRVEVLHDEHLSPLFMAAIEATEEAILNSLFAATDMTGRGGRSVQALPLERVLPLLRRYNRIEP